MPAASMLAGISLLALAALSSAAPVVEVVLAHYREDLSWTSEYEAPGIRFTVYSKGASPPTGAEVLPNVGREAHSFLHHIVKRYDSLAPWTVFSQAVRPTWGFEGGNAMSGHLSDNVQFMDYLRPYPEGMDSYFVLSAASHFPAGLQLGRVGMMYPNVSIMSKSGCPPRGANGWGPWWFEASHPHVTRAIPSMLDFYHRFVALDTNDGKNLTLAFSQGARFAVSRERIHKRPLEYYRRLLEQVSASCDPIQGYWLEAAWYDVFHPEALQSQVPVCALPPLPAGPAPNVFQAYRALRRRLRASGEALEALLYVGRGSYLRLSAMGLGYGALALAMEDDSAETPAATLAAPAVPAVLV